ncbi:hypothetical protein ACFE04_008489 [Oxalis oulophora]
METTSLSVKHSQNAESVTMTSSKIKKKKIFPPKDVQSVERLLNSVTLTDHRFTNSFQPKKLLFTEFGLSPTPIATTSSTHAEPYYVTPRSYSPLKSASTIYNSMAKIGIGSPTTSSPIGRPHCHCKQSKCLKLYCECFASGVYCDGCGCSCCRNKVETEAARQLAVKWTLLRNPNAFKPKIATSLSGAKDNVDEDEGILIIAKHSRGCNCKKTGCLKKYCECFRANVLCSDNCKCMDCKNFDGSEDLIAVPGDDQTNNTHIMQQINGSISSAVGSSGYRFSIASRKRTFQELVDSCDNKPPIHSLSEPQHEKVKVIRASPISAVHGDTVARIHLSLALSSLHLPCRSSNADINYPAFTKKLCSHLLIMTMGNKKHLANITPRRQELGKDERPEYSDEKGNLLKGKLEHDCNSSVYAEQERVLLVCFLDYLTKLISVTTNTEDSVHCSF